MTEKTPNHASDSFRLAFEDRDFLLSPSTRGVRFMLEYAKPEEILQAWGVRSTIVVFGSARVPSPERAAEMRAAAPPPGGTALADANGQRDNVIATGGGPGLMEAANRGASEAGAPSIGFNIVLPFEEHPNPYSTPELTFRFHYFAIRKMHLAMRANALAVFPGGFGTLDEAFEILNLQNTNKATRLPIVLVGSAFWNEIVNFEALDRHGMISHADLDRFDIVDTAEEAWNAMLRRGLKRSSPPLGPAGTGKSSAEEVKETE